MPARGAGSSGYNMISRPCTSEPWFSLRLSSLAASVVVGLSLAVAQTFPSAAQTATDAKPLPSTVLIFDGSGSMWAKMEGEKQIKLALAREAVKLALAKTAQATQLGLMSFGHRRTGDCSDVQLIAPPEAAVAPAFADRIMGPLEKLNPKGKGPLTAALREAAKLLGKTTGPRSIVLVHDDPDNCQQDTCAALAELQQSAPGVVVHVVGLGLKPEDASRYQCLTKPTGGKHVDAQDAAQIVAGIDEVMQLAALGATEATTGVARVAPAPVAVPVPQPVAVAPVAPVIDLAVEGPPAIRLRALLSKDRIAPGSRIRWSVTAEGAAEGQPPLAEVDGNDALLPIDPGGYKVRVVAGLVRGEVVVTVAARGQTLAEVVLNAGEIRIKAPLPADATVLVAERNAADPTAKPAKVTAGRSLGVWPHGQTSLLVPARALLLTLEQSELRSDWPIDMAAGQIRDVDVGQAGGRVSLDLLPSAGPPVAALAALGNQPVIFTIEEDDPDAPRGRREIARSASPTAEFVVAPGSYIIAATRGPLETRERVGVTAGEVVRRSLPLVASRVVITVRLAKSPLVVDTASDSFRLTRLDADREATLVMPGPAAIADVPPGRYRVEARRNNAAIRAEQVFEIRAGDYRAVTLEYQAGELRVNVAAGPEAGEPLSWRILDVNGRLVASGDESGSAQILSAGRYTVRTDASGKQREQAVDIRAGEVSSVRVP